MSDASEGREKVRESLSRLADELRGTPRVSSGEIVVRLTGEADAEYHFETAPGAASLQERPSGARPGGGRRVDVTGDPEVIRQVLDGERDALEAFAEGGIRIRGDLPYFSEVAVEAGLLEHGL